MVYKPENIKLVVTHDGVEQEIQGFTDNPISFDESTFVENPQPKKIKVEVTTKSSRCKDTIDWVEVEYGDEYKKPKKGEVGY